MHMGGGSRDVRLVADTAEGANGLLTHNQKSSQFGEIWLTPGDLTACDCAVFRCML